jgi:hypothetical protein
MIVYHESSKIIILFQIRLILNYNPYYYLIFFISNGVWSLYDEAITATIQNWGKEMPLKLSMLLNIFTKLKVNNMYLYIYIYEYIYIYMYIHMYM